MSLLKKSLFGLIAVFVIPALFFLLLEQGLRVSGFGKSFEYFNEIELDGRPYFQDNPTFIEQFYPGSLDITPLENTFSAESNDNVVRVFILGGSAARGFPNPAHGFSRHLEAMLKDALPLRQVEVINTAMTAINSHVVYETARSIPQGSADFAIVLMGNNEVIGPYGPGTFNQSFLSNLGLIRSLQALKQSRIGQLLGGAAAKANERDHKEELKWKGMQMFTSESVPQSDPRLETVYSHYQHNLADIVQILQGKGAHVLLSTVPVNLRHSAPFSSVHKAGLSDAQIDQWGVAVNRAKDSFDKQDWKTAILHYQSAVAIDPEYADTHFQLALSYENIRDFRQAAEHLNKARDLDSLRFRADSRINSIIKNVASTFADSQLTFVDSATAFGKESQPGQPGWNLFLEHVHYDFPGDYVLAREFSRAILDDLGLDRYEPLAEAEIVQRIGYPSNMTVKVMERVVNMVKSPPFTGQNNQAELQRFIGAKKLQAENQLGTVRDQITRRQTVLQSGTGDWRLRYELAHLLEHIGDKQGTYEQLTLLFSEYPHHRDSQIMLAKMLHKDGKYRQEVPYLEAALKNARGDETLIAQLNGWLGLVYFKLGNEELATEYLVGVTNNYPQQTHYVLQAYATLIRHSMQSGNTGDVNAYAGQAQRYSEGMVRAGKDSEYPMLYAKMSQIMSLAGDRSQARAWKQRQPKKPPARPAASQ
ncbi:MAG: tetratricopeptide repeat protein [Halioglobus sp.]